TGTTASTPCGARASTACPGADTCCSASCTWSWARCSSPAPWAIRSCRPSADPARARGALRRAGRCPWLRDPSPRAHRDPTGRALDGPLGSGATPRLGFAGGSVTHAGGLTVLRLAGEPAALGAAHGRLLGHALASQHAALGPLPGHAVASHGFLDRLTLDARV